MTKEDKSTWVVPEYGIGFLEPNEEEVESSDEGKEQDDEEVEKAS